MKKNVTLFIDTSKRDTTVVSIINNGKITTINEVSQKLKAQNLLIVLDKLLKTENLKLSNITEIKFNRGPGSFVGLRVGASIVNTLSFLFNIPINGKLNSITPLYD